MKLALRFLTLVLALLIAVGVSERQGVIALDRLGGALERVVDSDMARVFAFTHVRRLFRSMVVLEGDYLLSKLDADRKAMDKKMLSLGKEQLEQIERYLRLMPPEDTHAMADIRAVRDRWIALDAKVRALASADHDKGLELSKQHAKDPVNWEQVIGSLVKLSENRLASQVAGTNIIHASAKQTLSTVALSALGVALGFGVFIYLGIRRNVKDLVILNANLEGLVDARTAELAERERALRLILDSTGDAFVEMNREGRLTGVTSTETVRWFGGCVPGRSGAKYLFPTDFAQQQAFDMAFSQLMDDILPWELTSEQMPRRINTGNAVLELGYRPVLERGEFSKVLVIARDVTARVQAEKAEKNAKEQQTVLGMLLSDKAGFMQFVADCEDLIAGLSNSADLTLTKRNLHTLKGNTAVYGMSSVAEYCHILEECLAIEGQTIPSSKIADLGALWRNNMQGIQEFISGLGENMLERDGEEHQKLIDSLMHRRDYQEILSMVEMRSWCRAAERLARLRAQTEYVAKRLDRDVMVVVEHNDLRIPNDYLSRFWSVLVHVVRNAIGHGIESPSVREAAGKSPRATVTLCTRASDNQLVIEVRDDGSGIDVNRVHAVAKGRGVQLAEGPSLVDVVSADGVSTAAETTELSGRGVGLSAVRHACELEGGRITIVNEPGNGIAFQFRFRMPVVKTGALAAKLERRWSLLPSGNPSVDVRGSETVPLGAIRKSS